MFDMKHAVDVKLVDHTLVAGFHRANPPLIWKFDLERNHSFTISLQGEDGDWELGLTALKGDFYPIARFVGHDDASEAFQTLQKTLMKKTRYLPSLPKSWLGWLGLLIGLFAIFVILRDVYIELRHPGTFNAASVSRTNVVKPGVPQSADDVLAAPH